MRDSALVYIASYTNVLADIICVGIMVTFLDGFVGLLPCKTVKWTRQAHAAAS